MHMSSRYLIDRNRDEVAGEMEAAIDERRLSKSESMIAAGYTTCAKGINIYFYRLEVWGEAGSCSAGNSARSLCVVSTLRVHVTALT